MLFVTLLHLHCNSMILHAIFLCIDVYEFPYFPSFLKFFSNQDFSAHDPRILKKLMLLSLKIQVIFLLFFSTHL